MGKGRQICKHQTRRRKRRMTPIRANGSAALWQKADICSAPNSRYSITSSANLTICAGLASKTSRSGQREPKIVRQHTERHRDDENGYWQR